MSVKNFIPELWMPDVELELQKVLVYGGLCNRKYEGQITGAGDTVRVNQLANPTINTYTTYSEPTPEQLQDSQKVLAIDQQKDFSFWIDDIDKVQANAELMGPAVRAAGYGFADTLDQYIAGLYGSAGISDDTLCGSNGTPINVTSLNVDDFFQDCSEVMSNNNVPKVGRVGVIPPWVTNKISKAGITLSTDNASYFEDNFMGANYVGRAFGYDFFESVNVSKNSSDWDKTRIMLFTRDAITLAEQILNIEAARPAKGHQDLLKGLHVYGASIMRPDLLLTAYADRTAEA